MFINLADVSELFGIIPERLISISYKTFNFYNFIHIHEIYKELFYISLVQFCHVLLNIFF